MFNLKALAGQIGPGLVRTVVPLIVAWLASFGVVQRLGIDSTQIENAVTLLVAAVYWLAVRVLEVYVAPKFGRLLGSSRTPAYGTTSADGQAVDVTSLAK